MRNENKSLESSLALSLSLGISKEREFVVVRCVYHYDYIVSSFIMKKYTFSYLSSRHFYVRFWIRKIQSRSSTGCRYCNKYILLSSHLLPICCDVENYKHFSYLFSSYFCSRVTQHCCDLCGFTYVPSCTTGKLLIKLENIYGKLALYLRELQLNWWLS
jgi:hypothetical protein